jgi:hypothetical protein
VILGLAAGGLEDVLPLECGRREVRHGRDAGLPFSSRLWYQELSGEEPARRAGGGGAGGGGCGAAKHGGRWEDEDDN